MDTRRLVDILEHQAEGLLELAKKLSHEGNPLSEADRTLLRMALYPSIKEATDMIRFSFINGSDEPNDYDMRSLVDLFRC